MHLLDAPGPAAHEVASLVQVLGNLLDAHRAALVACEIELVDSPHDRSLALIHRELFLAPTAVAEVFGLDYAVAKGRLRAVEEALPRVLAHGARGVLGVLLALVLIEHGEDPAR
ncbi:MAG TPA: hypothetical protein VEU32_03245 [Burkholderiales bacterium]|nr:hypothetical protein [Burkholderiales bacterium]